MNHNEQSGGLRRKEGDLQGWSTYRTGSDEPYIIGNGQSISTEVPHTTGGDRGDERGAFDRPIRRRICHDERFGKIAQPRSALSPGQALGASYQRYHSALAV